MLHTIKKKINIYFLEGLILLFCAVVFFQKHTNWHAIKELITAVYLLVVLGILFHLSKRTPFQIGKIPNSFLIVSFIMLIINIIPSRIDVLYTQ